MMRHCDGTDPNLIRKVGEGSFTDGAYVPCDCGLVFDDVDHMVTYPHQKLVKDFGELRALVNGMPEYDVKEQAFRYLNVIADTQAFRSDLAAKRSP